MKKPLSYSSPSAFRQALEACLANIAREEAMPIHRLRRQIAFDRLLCRVFHTPASPWALKGGYAMELRLQTTRTTKDIDLSWRGKLMDKKQVAAIIKEKLQEVASTDLNDHFAFLVGERVMDLDAAPYGGGRFPVEARMAGRVFARFHVDVGVGDAVLNPLEEINARNWLDFAGIPAQPFLSINGEQQFAEKLHAYTLPSKGAPNTRARDLVDMVLLIRMKIHSSRTAEAVAATFKRRATHAIPSELSPPPAEWLPLYEKLAEECRLDETMNQAFAVVCEFFKQAVDKT